MSIGDEIKKQMITSRIKQTVIPSAILLSTGSTMLNLACTGRPFGGLAAGYFYHFVGGSSSGKTWIVHTVLAEASINPRFDDYAFIYDEPEHGGQMDREAFFGKALVSRIKSPRQADGENQSSETIEQMFDTVDSLLDKGDPFIYIVDSKDGLVPEKMVDLLKTQKKQREKGEEIDDSYGVEAAKAFSGGLKRVVPRLEKSRSILIFISQIRDKIGVKFGKKTTYSGGRAIFFWAQLEMWLSMIGEINKTVKGKPRQIGTMSGVKIEKNRFTGRRRDIEIPILNSYGVDDIGSCVDFLLEEGHWNKSKSEITATEFGLLCGREELIDKLTEQDKWKDIAKICGQVWDEIEEACATKRKGKYDTAS